MRGFVTSAPDGLTGQALRRSVAQAETAAAQTRGAPDGPYC